MQRTVQYARLAPPNAVQPGLIGGSIGAVQKNFPNSGHCQSSCSEAMEFPDLMSGGPAISNGTRTARSDFARFGPGCGKNGKYEAVFEQAIPKGTNFVFQALSKSSLAYSVPNSVQLRVVKKGTRCELSTAVTCVTAKQGFQISYTAPSNTDMVAYYVANSDKSATVAAEIAHQDAVCKAGLDITAKQRQNSFKVKFGTGRYGVAAGTYEFMKAKITNMGTYRTAYYAGMIAKCKEYNLKPVCDHPSYCRNDGTNSLYIGQYSHIAYRPYRRINSWFPSGWSRVANAWNGLCSYTRTANGNYALCNIPINTHAWRMPYQYVGSRCRCKAGILSGN